MSHRRLIDQLIYKHHVITPPNHDYRIKKSHKSTPSFVNEAIHRGQMGSYMVNNISIIKNEFI